MPESGVPPTMADGQTPLFGDRGSTRKIAKEAVKKVYQHVSSPKDSAFVEQRRALALQFRQKYHSNVNGAANVNRYFIGVFDTVTALGSYLFLAALIVLAVAILAVIGYLQSLFCSMQPYRPENLLKHEQLKQYYPQER